MNRKKRYMLKLLIEKVAEGERARRGKIDCNLWGLCWHTHTLALGTDICTTLNVNKYVQYWLVFF